MRLLFAVMTEKQRQKLSGLKTKFKALPPKKREHLGVCFLKVQLGVHDPQEFGTLIDFLDGFDMDIVPENLDSMISYFHADTHTLPEFIALEASISNITIPNFSPSHILPTYDPDNVETLKEGVKPFNHSDD